MNHNSKTTHYTGLLYFTAAFLRRTASKNAQRCYENKITIKIRRIARMLRIKTPKCETFPNKRRLIIYARAKVGAVGAKLRELWAQFAGMKY